MNDLEEYSFTRNVKENQVMDGRFVKELKVTIAVGTTSSHSEQRS